VKEGLSLVYLESSSRSPLRVRKEKMVKGKG
jgi:hypothetical protein